MPAEAPSTPDVHQVVLPGKGEARVCLALLTATLVFGLLHLTLVALDWTDGQFTLGILQLICATGAACAFFLWLYEASANLAYFDVDGLSYSPAWSVGVFFVPLLNCFLPIRALQELWKASDPRETVGGEAWKKAPGTWLIPVWWISLLLLIPVLALMIGATLYDAVERELGDLADVASLCLAGVLLLSFLCSLTLMAIVRGVQRRQEQKYRQLHGGIIEQAVPRFRWPVRLFLAIVLLDVVFHSLATLTPYRTWLADQGMPLFPKGLPTQSEISSLAAKESKTGSPLEDRVFESLDSVWDYFKPWPDRSVRAKMPTWDERSMYLFYWVTSRMDFCEHLLITPQRWTMFSPNAAKGATVARIRLLYADKTVQEIRLSADPPDLTSYGHWFVEKTLDYELKVASDWDSRVGYCNYLAHRHRQNAAGSPLDKIYVYKVQYDYPGPDEDVIAKLRAQNGPPNWDKDGPFFVYDPTNQDPDHHRRARKLSESERKSVQTELARAAAK